MRNTHPPVLLPQVKSLWMGACLAAWWLCWPVSSAAQTTIAQVQSLDRFEAEQERLRQRMSEQPKGYEDQYFGAEDIQRIAVEEQVQDAEPTGLRTLLAESRLETNQQNASGQPRQRETNLGTRLEYRYETLNHGEWVVQADVRRHSGDDAAFSSLTLPSDSRSGQRVTLRNQSFPVTPFVLADGNLGDISSEVTDGLTRGQQFSLGNSNLRGASAHLFARGFDLRVGLGTRGQLVGGPYATFEATQGEVAWIGYTHRFDPATYAAVQVNRANQTPATFDANIASNRQNTTSVAAAVGRGYALNEDGDQRIRLTAMQSRTDGGATGAESARGIYLDTGLMRGRNRLEGGLYLTEPRLRFADQSISSGSSGLYARFQRQDLRVNWGMGINFDRQQPEATGGATDWTTTSLNAYWNHRLGRTQNWGGNLQYTLQNRDTGAASERSANGNLYYADRWMRNLGYSRLQWTSRRNQALVSDGPAATGDVFSWEQEWWAPQEPGAQTSALSSQLGWARDRSLGQTITYPTAGITWQTWLPDNWSLGGALRYTSRQGNLATSQGLAGSIQTEKRLARDWTLGASLLMNQAVVNTPTSGGSAGAPLSVSRNDDKSIWLFLRFENQQGRAYGYGPRGAQGAGTGRITGLVFLDANRDGIQQIDEPGVGGVEVFLNQRQRTTTDAQGRYEFAIVPTGQQFLSLRPESVPLPWGEGPRSRQTVEVPLRGAVIAPLAVVKDNE